MITQNIEAELSYAYLHAVAAKAGVSCKPADRHDDSEGVDAELNFRGDTSHAYLKHIQLNIQLKATVSEGGKNPDYLSYFLAGKHRYDKLRTNDSEIYKILVVLYLPEDSSEWLQCSEEELLLKKAAYWVNLYGAEPSSNDSGQTIYIPRRNLLTPEELKALIELAANKTIPAYKKPLIP